MLAQCAHLSTGKRMRSRRAVLDAANMQRSCSEVDLFPAKIANLRCAQPMPKRKQHHECVALALPVRARAIDQLLDFVSSEMLPGA
jgi:CTP-dependent riboflavin kinase